VRASPGRSRHSRSSMHSSYDFRPRPPAILAILPAAAFLAALLCLPERAAAVDPSAALQEVELAVDGLMAADEAGSSVAISGNTAIVGTYHDQYNRGQGLNTAGAAYVFVREGAKWTQQAKLEGDADA